MDHKVDSCLDYKVDTSMDYKVDTSLDNQMDTSLDDQMVTSLDDQMDSTKVATCKTAERLGKCQVVTSIMDYQVQVDSS